MKIKLVFDKPEAVTPYDEIVVSLSPKFVAFVQLLGDKFDYIERMVKQKVEIKETKVASIVSAGRAAATAAVLLSTVMKLALRGALNQLWALINGL
jgi:hypothetical protein